MLSATRRSASERPISHQRSPGRPPVRVKRPMISATSRVSPIGYATLVITAPVLPELVATTAWTTTAAPIAADASTASSPSSQTARFRSATTSRTNRRTAAYASG